MSEWTKEILSGSTHGRGIKITQAATPGDLVHMAINDTDLIDEVYLFAVHNHTTYVDVTVEFGGTTDPDDLIVTRMQPRQEYVICPGHPLRNNLAVRVFASVADVVAVFGHVHREA